MANGFMIVNKQNIKVEKEVKIKWRFLMKTFKKFGKKVHSF